MLHQLPSVSPILLPIWLSLSIAGAWRALLDGHYDPGIPFVDVEGPHLLVALSLRWLLSTVLDLLHPVQHVSLRSRGGRMARAGRLVHVSGHLHRQSLHHLLGCLPKAKEHEPDAAHPTDQPQDQSRCTQRS